jgi:hypothetical protein
VGALVGAQGLNFLVVAFSSSYRVIQALLVLAFVGAVTSMNLTVAGVHELAVMSLLSAFLGLSLMTLASQELYRLDRIKDNGIVPFSLSLFGVLGGVLTWAGDRTHYMNRSEPRWSYIDLSFSGFLVVLAAIFTIPWCASGCKCCSACCGCCKDCCGKIDDDDE